MFGLGAPELIIILVIILLLFGGKKLPELSKSIGQALRDVRGGLSDDPKTNKDSSTSSSDSESTTESK